jgi:hypothetical protein
VVELIPRVLSLFLTASDSVLMVDLGMDRFANHLGVVFFEGIEYFVQMLIVKTHEIILVRVSLESGPVSTFR